MKLNKNVSAYDRTAETSKVIVIDPKYNSFYLQRLLHQHGLIIIQNVNSLAYAFYMTNFSSFVIFRPTKKKKTNCQTSITSDT